MRLKAGFTIFLKRIRTVPVLLLISSGVFAYQKSPALTREEISNILLTDSADARDTHNRVADPSAINALFAHSLQQIADKNFKTTKYILEEPKNDIETFFRCLTEKAASAPWRQHFPAVSLPVSGQGVKALPMLAAVFFTLISFSVTFKRKFIPLLFQFHFLIPLRV